MNGHGALSGEASRVFISHSIKDKAVADLICESLEKNRIPCWIAPRNIQPGEAWPGAIISGIRQCEVMVLVFSQHSNESPQVLREIDRAVQRKLKIVTYRIDDTVPGGDLEYFLSTVQWLDASDTDPGDRMDFLVKSVRDQLPSEEDRPGQPPVQTGPVAGTALPEPSKRKPAGSGRMLGLLLTGILIAVLAWATFQFLRDSSPEPVFPPQSAQAGNSLAVLPFLNLTGTTELEWLRNGLPEMVITDLAQFRSFRVLSSQELHQAVAVDGSVPTTLASTDELRRLGQAAQASSVLTGSFARSGDTVEISIKIQDSETGKILLATREAGSQENLFEIIDELSAVIRNGFGIVGDGQPDQDLRNVTTESMEAYQYYVEGLQFDLQVRLEEAIPYLRKAVEIDPAFAMAHARLGWIYQNLGRATESAESLGIAFEHVDRLPGRERYLVEGLHYTLRWDTYHLAVDAFQNALALDRSMNSTRHQLATVYAKLEMYKEAIEVWDALVSNKYRYPGVENGLAITNAALGQFEPGESIIQQFLADNPDNAMMHVSLGWHYTSWGKIEQAINEFVAADERLPTGSPFLLHGLLRAHVVDHDYVAARTVADQLVAAGDPYSMFVGLKNLARLNLLSGQPAEALTTLEQAVAAYPTANAFTALARLRTASVLMEVGKSQEAITEAQQAIGESLGEWPEWEARFLMASAEYSLGNAGRAEEIVNEISQQAARQPDQILNRMLHHLRGRFAMVRGEHAQAVEELEMAAALLSANGVEFHFQRNPDHASVWYDLGMANFQADSLEEAHKWFTRIVESRIERSLFPVEYVRSYYQLGRLAERLDRQDEAQLNFSKFLEYWGNGSLDPDWVAYARSHSQ